MIKFKLCKSTKIINFAGLIALASCTTIEPINDNIPEFSRLAKELPQSESNTYAGMYRAPTWDTFYVSFNQTAAETLKKYTKNESFIPRNVEYSLVELNEIKAKTIEQMTPLNRFVYIISVNIPRNQITLNLKDYTLDENYRPLEFFHKSMISAKGIELHDAVSVKILYTVDE